MRSGCIPIYRGCLLMALLLAGSLGADDIAVPLSNYTGSATKTSGNIITGGTIPINDFKISWNITQGSGPLYTYNYTLSAENGGALPLAVVQFYLQVSTLVTPSNVNTMISGASPSISSVSNAPISPNGLSYFISSTNPTFTFTTSLVPMWGDFFTLSRTATSNGTTQNANYSIGDPTSSTTNFSGWIPVPGIQTPEPMTWLILGSTLLMAFWIKHRRLPIKA